MSGRWNFARRQEASAEEVEIKRLKIALHFYADEHHWQALVWRKNGNWEGWDGTIIANDAGRVARTALGWEE